jgi:hypothetical protein
VDLGRVHLRAGEIVAAVRADLVAKAGTGSAPLLLTGYPLFVTDSRGTPLAQVFHYGLSDSVSPPFGPLTGELLPLTPEVVRDPAPLLHALPGARLFHWSAESLRFESAAREHQPVTLPVLEVSGPDDGVSWPQPTSRSGWSVGAGGGTRCEIVVAAPGNAARQPGQGSGSSCSGELPRDFLETEARLYGGRAYWWIELSTDSGRPLAASPARRLELGPRPSRRTG